MEADGPIPERLPDPEPVVEVKRGRGRPRKEETGQVGEKKSFVERIGVSVKARGVLSHSEAEKLRDSFTAALKDDLKYLDQFLAWYSKDDDMPPIWGNMDDEEVDTLASVLLKRAERSPATAEFVRNVVDGADYIDTAIIVVPRLIETTKQVSKRPRQPKKTRRA